MTRRQAAGPWLARAVMSMCHPSPARSGNTQGSRQASSSQSCRLSRSWHLGAAVYRSGMVRVKMATASLEVPEDARLSLLAKTG